MAGPFLDGLAWQAGFGGLRPSSFYSLVFNCFSEMAPGKKCFVLLVLLFFSLGCVEVDIVHKIRRDGKSDVTFVMDGQAMVVGALKGGIGRSSFPARIQGRLMFGKAARQYNVSCMACSQSETEEFIKSMYKALRESTKGMGGDLDFGGGGSRSMWGSWDVKPVMSSVESVDGVLKMDLFNGEDKPVKVSEVVVMGPQGKCSYRDVGVIPVNGTRSLPGNCRMSELNDLSIEIDYTNPAGGVVRTGRGSVSVETPVEKEEEEREDKPLELKPDFSSEFGFPSYKYRLSMVNPLAEEGDGDGLEGLTSLTYTVIVPSRISSTNGVKIGRRTVQFDLKKDGELVVEWRDLIPFALLGKMGVLK